MSANQGVRWRSTAFITRYVAIFCVIAAFTALSYQRNGTPRQGIDDAEITMVYATHLAQGDGLVYNAGGERVEGFTSALWMLVCAAAILVTPNPVLALTILCVSLLALTHTLYTVRLDRLTNAAGRARALSPASALYLALIVASPPYITWMTITLMDTCLWGTLVALAVLWATGDDQDAHAEALVSSSLMICLLLARPEAMALCPSLLAARALRSWSAGRTLRQSVASVTTPAIVFVPALALLTAARLWYFGYPLPNTYYAKVSPSASYNLLTGTAYLIDYLRSTWPAALSALVIVVYLVSRHLSGARSATSPVNQGRRRIGIVELIGGLSFVLLVLPALSGGDHFVWFRFYQPVYPLLVFAALCALDTAHGWCTPRPVDRTTGRRFRAAVAGIAGAAVLLVGTGEGGWLRQPAAAPLTNEFAIAETDRRLGRLLEQTFRPFDTLPSLGVVTAGGIKMTYDGEVIDLMGLNNTAMAHSPGDRRGLKNHAAFNVAVLFGLSPDVLIPSSEHLGDERTGWQMAIPLRGINHDPQFIRRYVPGRIRVRDHGAGTWVTGYFARPFIDRLRSTGWYDIVLDQPT